MDLVLDAAVGAALLHALTDGTDEVVSDPEWSVQPVLSHRLTQTLQHVAPVGVAHPLTLRQDDQTLGWFGWRF